MTQTVPFMIDGVELEGRPGQTILEAAQDAGIYIPRLCYKEGITAHGSCRICTVLVNGRPTSACTTPIGPGMLIESDSERVNGYRRDVVDMLFVEGNHFCMFCEKSGNCELQALAYRLGITAPKFPYMFPKRDVDASHPDLFIDRDRCILCARCVRTSKEKDGKNVFQFVGRGLHKKIAFNAAVLADTDVSASDEAIDACPVGAILRKRVGYVTPVGERRYDHEPIGSHVTASGDDEPAPASS
jgi:[NiFe] hydrogenase diaphorase moiety small subunit